MTTAEIITIGDELLIGQVVDTNSAWIAQRLNGVGIPVRQITSVSDTADAIVGVLDDALSRSQVILVTGGLGPTNDDITKITLSRYFNSPLRLDEDVLADVEKIFATRGKPVTEVNRRQAEVPEKCIVLRNPLGTAPGMWFTIDGRIVVSMPGVPHEMKGMMEQVLARLSKQFTLPAIVHRTILTQGAGESFLAELIREWEEALPANIKLAYLPAAGMVRLRLSGTGPDEEALRHEIDEEVKKLHWLIDDFIFGYDDATLEAIVGKLLADKGASLATAESCTGGYIAHRITTVPGSSRYYMGSVVAYADRVKELFLGVPDDMLLKHGAVSEAVVRTMAEQAAKKFSTTYAIACSGIAGPDGGTADKPVGTVWIAISTPDGCISKKLQLGNNRMRIIMETSLNVLNMLRKILVGKHAYDAAASATGRR